MDPVRRALFVLLSLACFFVRNAHAQTAADSAAIMRAVEHWEQGWNEADVALATRDYAEDIDWTNAFGTRVQGRDSLTVRLGWILGHANITAGQSEYGYHDLAFLTPDIALLRSKAIVEGQRTMSGEPMDDRHIHHLRVFERRDGHWLIVSHLIAQAREKRGPAGPPPGSRPPR